MLFLKAKKLFPFFDVAYQGFSSGDLDHDAKSVRHFVKQGHELFVAQSFAKNMGLYSEFCFYFLLKKLIFHVVIDERVGNLTVVVNNPDVIPKMKSQFTTVVRVNYSNPPSHGARIASTILNNKALFFLLSTQ